VYIHIIYQRSGETYCVELASVLEMLVAYSTKFATYLPEYTSLDPEYYNMVHLVQSQITLHIVHLTRSLSGRFNRWLTRFPFYRPHITFIENIHVCNYAHVCFIKRCNLTTKWIQLLSNLAVIAAIISSTATYLAFNELFP
jgi:hypothetical protein